MADAVDRANDIAEAHLALALTNIELPPPNDITECVDCGVRISSERKQNVPNAIRCIDCETLVENGRGGQ